MKSFPFVIEDAENVPAFINITRDTEEITFTDHHEDLTVGATTWTAEPGCAISQAEFNTDGSVSTMTVELTRREGGPLSDADTAIGRYDGSPIMVRCADPANLVESPAPFGSVFTGYIGNVTISLFGTISINCRGELSKLRGDISEQYGVMCRADLGDHRCKVPILPADIVRNTLYPAGSLLGSFVRVRGADTGEPLDYQNLVWECTTEGTTAGVQPDYSGASPDDMVTDGTAVFTARNAYLRYAEVDGDPLSPQSFILTELPDPRAVDEYYTLGTAIIRSGRYSGFMIPIRRWTEGTLKVESWWPVSHMIEAGTLIEIHPGCMKTEAACQSFVWSFGPAPLGNIKRRRAEPFLPTQDAMTAQG